MDTTDKYRAMCDCKEVQGQAPPLGPKEFIKPVAAENRTFGRYTRNIWLPRQDQIQAMFEGHYPKEVMFERFCRWYPEHYFESFEQDWLAFMMGELHGKVWTGTEWAAKGGDDG